jgi:hypothetical protein
MDVDPCGAGESEGATAAAVVGAPRRSRWVVDLPCPQIGSHAWERGVL